MSVDESSPAGQRGRVTFGRFYHGHNEAAHGGALGLFFDDTLGVFVATEVGSRVRTAFLHINYRAITPIDRELQFEIEIKRCEGRKIFVQGRLYDAHVLCADAEMLMLQLRPEQQ